VLVVFASVTLLRKIGPSGPAYLRVIISLAPVVPVIFICRAMIRFVQDCDEFERKIELESIALSCVVTGLLFLSLGMLANSNVITLDGSQVAIWVFPSLCGLYGLTKCITSWRYR
jgi:hypothetical protein